MVSFNSMRTKLIFTVSFLAAALSLVAQTNSTGESSRYTYQKDHDPDGIGKFYQGREIAQVMGHEGADWLERPERMEEERPDLLMAALKLHPGDSVADIGAGTGYFTWRMAKVIGPTGKAYAVEIQQEMLDILAQKMIEHETTNFVSVLGTITDTKTPGQSH